MKTRHILPFIFILFASIGFSQVTEQIASLSTGPENAFVIDLENADQKMAENVWKDYVGQMGKTKRDRKSKEYRSTSIVIPAIDPDYNVNLTGKFEDLRGNSRIYVWIKMDDHFIDSENHTEEARGVKSFLESYAIEVEKAVVQKEVEQEQKSLRDLEKHLSKLGKKKDGYNKDIEKAEKAILEAEKNIEENIIDQENKKIEIEEQKAILKKAQEKLKAVGTKD